MGERVLDVGCGTGRLATELAKRGARVWGIDPSEEMLTQARSNAAGTVAFKRGKAEAMPFKDGWFDRAVFRLVVHLLDRRRAFTEIARVLAPRGGRPPPLSGRRRAGRRTSRCGVRRCPCAQARPGGPAHPHGRARAGSRPLHLHPPASRRADVRRRARPRRARAARRRRGRARVARRRRGSRLDVSSRASRADRQRGRCRVSRSGNQRARERGSSKSPGREVRTTATSPHERLAARLHPNRPNGGASSTRPGAGSTIRAHPTRTGRRSRST